VIAGRRGDSWIALFMKGLPMPSQYYIWLKANTTNRIVGRLRRSAPFPVDLGDGCFLVPCDWEGHPQQSGSVLVAPDKATADVLIANTIGAATGHLCPELDDPRGQVVADNDREINSSEPRMTEDQLLEMTRAFLAGVDSLDVQWEPPQAIGELRRKATSRSAALRNWGPWAIQPGIYYFRSSQFYSLSTGKVICNNEVVYVGRSTDGSIGNEVWGYMRVGVYTAVAHPSWEGWDDIIKTPETMVGALPFSRDNWKQAICKLESELLKKPHRPWYNLKG
jgi:hypothetical protein